MNVINAVIPVFAIIAIGAGLQKFDFLSERQFAGITRIVYWVGLPCLLFNKISTAEYGGGSSIRIFLVVISGMVVGMILSYAIVKITKMPFRTAGPFVQASFRGNLAFIGLPVIIYAASGMFDNNGASVETLAVLVLAPIVPVYNIVSVLVLLAGRRKLDRQAAKQLFREVATNPLLIASVLALTLSLLHVPMPTVLARTTDAVGQMSLPLALVSIGGSLVNVELRGSVYEAATAAVIKVAATPLVGILLVRWYELGALESKLALIYLACPTAATSYVLVEQLGGDRAVATGSIVISTLLAMLSLSLVIAFG